MGSSGVRSCDSCTDDGGAEYHSWRLFPMAAAASKRRASNFPAAVPAELLRQQVRAYTMHCIAFDYISSMCVCVHQMVLLTYAHAHACANPVAPLARARTLWARAAGVGHALLAAAGGRGWVFCRPLC